MAGQDAPQVLVQRGHAVVVEPRRHGAEHGQLGRVDVELLAVAGELAAHVAQRVLGPAALELVDHHHLGEVEHVDLLELRCGAELRRHHVDRHIDEGHDGGITLTDARCLDDHEIGTPRLGGEDDLVEGGRHFAARGARRQRSEEDLWAVDGVHADAVAQQRAAAPAPRGIDRDHGDAQLVALVEAEPPQQLVGQRRLARAAGARDAEHRDVTRRGGVADRGDERVVRGAGFEDRDRAGQLAHRPADEREHVDAVLAVQRAVAFLDHRVDHSGEAHPLAVVGREDPGHTAALQLLDLARHDHPATTAVDANVAGALLAQAIEQVREVLDVAALVRADGDALDVFLQGGVHDVVDGSVVPQVDHLGALRLQDSPHDVDRRVMAVEQARRRDESHRVLRPVEVTITGRIVVHIVVRSVDLRRRHGSMIL